MDINSLVRYSSVTLNEDERYQATVTVAGSVKKYAYDASTGAGSVSVGMKVNVLAHTTYWALIERNGHKGYYPVTGLKIHLDEFISPVEMTFEATVICAAPAYSAALESANRLGTVPIATNVTVTAYTDKWARISYSGVTAYLLKNTLSVTDYIELKNGVSAANQILALQKKLEDLGYFDGLPAGNYGSLTTNAVSRFQSQIGLSASGVADKTTQRVLYGGHAPQSPIKTANLSKGSVGNDVTRLQTRLTYKGYLSAGIDGDFGNITQSAVKLYQKKAGLEETGVADPTTPSFTLFGHYFNLYPLVSRGYMFVYVMFMLSGFVLMLGSLNGRYPSVKRFYLGRIARIVPSYLVCLVIFGCFVIIPDDPYPSAGFMLKDVLSHLTFTHNLVYEGYQASHIPEKRWTKRHRSCAPCVCSTLPRSSCSPVWASKPGASAPWSAPNRSIS